MMMIPRGEAAVTRVQITFDTYAPYTVCVQRPNNTQGDERSLITCNEGKLNRKDKQKQDYVNLKSLYCSLLFPKHFLFAAALSHDTQVLKVLTGVSF